MIVIILPVRRHPANGRPRLAPTESGVVYSFERNGRLNSKSRTCESHELAAEPNQQLGFPPFRTFETSWYLMLQRLE